jgi:hypothetical protein
VAAPTWLAKDKSVPATARILARITPLIVFATRDSAHRRLLPFRLAGNRLFPAQFRVYFVGLSPLPASIVTCVARPTNRIGCIRTQEIYWAVNAEE